MDNLHIVNKKFLKEMLYYQKNNVVIGNHHFKTTTVTLFSLNYVAIYGYISQISLLLVKNGVLNLKLKDKRHSLIPE